MGFFNKTEDEIKRSEEQKKLKNLISYVNSLSSLLPSEEKSFFVNYLENIKNGSRNDFDDVETLEYVIYTIIKMLNDDYPINKIRDYFNKVIDIYGQIVSENRDNYEKNKEIFLEQFMGIDGIISHNIFDNAMYAMFDNKDDYFEIVNIINKNDLLIENYGYIKKYISSVCKYCINQDILKRDIISYLNKFDYVIDADYEKYNNEELENAKRRIGVYNISQKELASCDYSLRRIESYLEQFEIYMNEIEEKKSSISNIILNGQKIIRQEEIASIDKIKNLIEQEKQLLTKRLDEYLLELEEIMKDKSDETFRQILSTYKKQVADFQALFKGYSMAASKDLLAIQKATEESVNVLKNYVNNEPQLKELLSKAEEQNSVRQKIVELVSKEEKLLEFEKQNVHIEGYNRVMVPYGPMTLPETVTTNVIDAFDDNVPLKLRMEKIEEKMKQNEEKGEIYHSKTMQIVGDLIEGDWPYLWGPSGTGKSHLMQQVADLIGIDFKKAGKITEKYSLLGYNDPQGRYITTPTFVAALYGSLLLLDEFDNGNQDTTLVLNDIYSELLNKISHPNRTCQVIFGNDIPVDINPNFRLISAGNTCGEGENSIFSSRGKIDESLQERMTPIFIDYDSRVEEKILNAYPEWYNFFINFRKACSNYALNNGLETALGTATTRDASALRKYIDHDIKTVDQILFEKFIQIKKSEYKSALARDIAKMYDISCNGNLENPEYNGSLTTVSGKVLAKKFVYYCKKKD